MAVLPKHTGRHIILYHYVLTGWRRKLFSLKNVLAEAVLFFSFFFLFRAIRVAHGSSQARGWIGATAASTHHSHSNSGSKPCLLSTPQLTAKPDHLTHWVRPGIEPSSSWILFGFVSSAPQLELLNIKSQYLSTHLFHIPCDETGSTHKALLHHTWVRCCLEIKPLYHHLS